MVAWTLPAELVAWITALAGLLHARLAGRLVPPVRGALFAQGCRTVASWPGAAGLGRDFRLDYYFLGGLGRKAESVASLLLCRAVAVLAPGDRLLFALDDAPTKRAGRRVEGAGIRHNPTPGPAGQHFLSGHVRVTIAWVLRHPLWGAIGLPLQERDGWVAYFCTDPRATVAQGLEAVADRSAIEQDFHDLKEVHGLGQQQVRRYGANVAVYHLNLWLHTLIELWAWGQPPARRSDRRDRPWDARPRRPSHADRRNALRRACLRTEIRKAGLRSPLSRKIQTLMHGLIKRVT
jgi:hypothetical protein